jgi:hypothetical protein
VVRVKDSNIVGPSPRAFPMAFGERMWRLISGQIRAGISAVETEEREVVGGGGECSGRQLTHDGAQLLSRNCNLRFKVGVDPCIKR